MLTLSRRHRMKSSWRWPMDWLRATPTLWRQWRGSAWATGWWPTSRTRPSPWSAWGTPGARSSGGETGVTGEVDHSWRDRGTGSMKYNSIGFSGLEWFSESENILGYLGSGPLLDLWGPYTLVIVGHRWGREPSRVFFRLFRFRSLSVHATAFLSINQFVALNYQPSFRGPPKCVGPYALCVVCV